MAYLNYRQVISKIWDSTATAIGVKVKTAAGGDAIGEVQASPTAYTVLARLKDIATGLTTALTGIVLAAGSAIIGKVRMVDSGGTEVTEATGHSIQAKLIAGTAIAGKVGIDQATANANEVVVKVVKTIQTELKAITAVAADVQSLSSELDLSGNIKQVTIFIDHAKDNAAASVGQGTEYVIQVSEKATGNDTWRSIPAFTALITVPTAMITDAEEVAGQTVIECGVVTPVVGDILFFKHATIGSSEWANVVARADGVSVTLESGLTTTQAQGTYYTQGEHYQQTLNTQSYTRLRVVCNNTKGTTNKAIVWRCSAITAV